MSRGSMMEGSAPAQKSSTCRKWVRLLLLSVGATVCCGIIPGAPLFIRLFAKAGVGSSACPPPNATSVASHGDPPLAACSAQSRGVCSPCTDQSLMVAAGFNAGQMVSFLGLLPSGIIFDRYGGKQTSVIGSSFCCLGMLMLQIPLLGVWYGYDATTAVVLPFAVIITDWGAMLNSFCIFSILWHFPKQQTFVIAVATATYQISSLLPAAMQKFIDHTGASLVLCMTIYISVVAIGGFTCAICAPDIAEYREAAREALGVPLPKPSKKLEICKKLRTSQEVLRVNFCDHLFLIIGVASTMNFYMLYASLVGNYAQLLFHDDTAGDYMASLYVNMNAAIGSTILPLFSFMLDKCGNTLPFFIVMLMVTNIISCALVTVPTWNGQIANSACSALFMCLFAVVMQKYIMAYCMPTQFGTTQGVLMMYMMVSLVAMAVVSYSWIGSMPNDTAQSLGDPLQGLSAFGVVFMTIFCVRFLFVGLPDTPVLLPSDEAELADTFGCKTLDEVLYVTKVSDRRTLLKMLSSHDVKVMAELMQQIDYERMEELLGGPEEKDAEQSPEPEVSKPEVREEPTVSVVVSPVAAEQELEEYEEPMVFEVGCGEAVQTKITVGGGMSSFCRCWAPSSNSAGSRGLSAPLLQQQAVVHVGERTDRTKDAAERAEAVRDLNERMLKAVRANEGAAFLRFYEIESTQLLWEAYQDLFVMLDSKEMDDFEKQTDDICSEEEWKELMERRPAVKMIMLKMTAFRLRKKAFG